jgi:serine protease
VMDPGDLNGIDDDGNGKIDDLIGWNFIADVYGTENNDPTDPGTHGTRVAGLAGARTNNGIGAASLSWNPVLMPISCSRPGATSSIYRGYDAIIYAAENGAQVINCSWGGSTFSSANNDAVAYAQSLGAIIVAAAGNSNNSIPIYPAAYPGVVAIASLMNSGVKWSGSNYGGYLDAGAPNESVYTTSGSSSYASITGTTSYASPIGAAMLALIRSQNPGWTSAQVINQLKATCDDIDALNPGRENLLGGGKINAYRALTELSPTQMPKLHLALFEVGTPNDDNGNGAVEPAENFLLNLTLRNYSDFSDDIQVVLSSSNPNVVINQNTVNATIAADDWLSLADVFSVYVLPGTPSQYITFNLSITSPTPILSGSTASFKILVHNGGSFVWEAKASARNQSGVFIRNSLQSMGKQVVYGTDFPASFHSFDAVYLSFGAVDANVGRLSSNTQFYALKNYLESGGRLYLEGADTVAWDLATYFPLIDGVQDGHHILWPLLGVADAQDGSTNPISHLAGQPGPTRNLLFTSSAQTNNDYIDLFEPLPDVAVPAFIEDDYGIVGIAAAGGYDQRTLIFSYALSELTDAKSATTRLDFLEAVVDFYEAAEVTLAVTLSSFLAIWQDAALLKWSTASETELLGWNIYRAQEADIQSAIKLNPSLIAPALEASQGAQYSFTDSETAAGSTYYYWLEALSYNSQSDIFGHISLTIPMAEEEDVPEIVLPTELLPAFPNPFSLHVVIPYRINDKATVQIDVYDIRGRKVKSMTQSHTKAGKYFQAWDGLDKHHKPLPSGIYFYRMRSENYNKTMKIIKAG